MGAFLPGNRSVRIMSAVGVLLLLLLVILWIVQSRESGPKWLKTVFESMVEKNRLVSVMRSDLLASAEAEKSSVMADTDDASRKFAEQSIRASEAVEKARTELGRILETERSGNEKELFQEFSSCWGKYQEVDRELLPLAVQNTNLKAMRLSFVPAGEAIRRMETALGQLMDSNASSPDAVRVTRLSSEGLINALNIYTLQAPHIAETTETKMDEIESAMKGLDSKVRKTLESLQALVNEDGKPFLDAAWSAYRDFQEINAEIIVLSRQNSNIRSLAISLGEKRVVMAQCLDTLAALQEHIQSTTFRATR